MKRRTFLAGGAATATALASHPARSHYVPSDTKQPFGPSDLAANAARLREQFLKDFDPAYVENVILPHFLVSVYTGERPPLPMIGLNLTKENALPADLWGLISETW